MPAQTLADKTLSRIYGKKRGWVFTQVHFRDLGNDPMEPMLFGQDNVGQARRLSECRKSPRHP